MTKLTLAACAMLTLLLVVPVPATALSAGQIDTFESGTTLGWTVPGPSPNPPTNSPSGGPAGVDDAFLRLAATGISGPGGRLSVVNTLQWTGNYLLEGITHIRMDVNNFGTSDLFLRLLFQDFEGTEPSMNLALSAEATFVPANSGWTTVSFPITPAHLVPGAFGTVIGALSDTTGLRIFHNPDPFFGGPGLGIPAVNAVLGVDNITALVPEPSGILLTALGLIALCAGRVVKVAAGGTDG